MVIAVVSAWKRQGESAFAPRSVEPFLHKQERTLAAWHMFLLLTRYYLNPGSPCEIGKGWFMSLHSIELGMLQVIVNDTIPKNFPF